MKLFAIVLAVILLVGLLPVIPVAADGVADLTVTALSWTPADGQVKPGTKVIITAIVKNEGDAAVTTPFTVTAAFGTQEILRTSCTTSLSPRSSAKVTFPAWTAVAGDKMIAVRVDADNAVIEKSEKNNTRQRNLRVASDRLSPAYNADAVAEAGMFDLTFNDDFTDLSGFDNEATGREGYKWYLKRRWAQADMTPSDYHVKDGIMTMAYEDDRYTIGASTVDCETQVGYTFNKGYIEARIRIPMPFNSDSKTAIWSIPIENWAEDLTNGRYVEADWMEYFGKSDHYGTTLHDMETVAGGKNWYSQANDSKILNDAAWHVMGWLWDEDILHCYIDGVEVHTQAWSANDIPIPINSVREGEIKFDGVFDVLDSQNMMLFIAGSSTMPMEFDYLRIWQHGGQQPTPPTTTTKPTSKTTVKTTATKVQKPTVTTTTRPSTAPSTTVPTAETTVTTETTTTVATIAPSTTAPTTGRPNEPKNEEKPLFTRPFFLAGVAVGLAVSLSLFFLLKRRKK